MAPHPPEIPEFRGVRQDADTGRWHAVHKLTGKPIEADSLGELQRHAMAVRVAMTLKTATGANWRTQRYWPDGEPVTASQEAALTRIAETARLARERLMSRPAEADQ
ncbi:hypothetical protein [Microbispora bryophytorum]|uniref:hypothetical protein n=1 Tax=Microbispora bryophytorum TaxID=1460882 RepID=UPI0033D688B8